MPIPSLNTEKTTITSADKAAVVSADRAVVVPAGKADVALASEVGLGFSPGNKTQPQTRALAPEVCLPIQRKTSTRFPHHKLILPFTLALTLITSCDPPKPTPKTTTHTS